MSNVADLQDSIVAKIGGLAGIDLANVQLGESKDMDKLTETPSNFPRVEFFPDTGNGEDYISEREIKGLYGFEFWIYTLASTEDRTSGNDLKVLQNLEGGVRTALYEFNSDSPKPADGFQRVEADYRFEYFYSVFNNLLNVSILNMEFWIEHAATTA